MSGVGGFLVLFIALVAKVPGMCTSFDDVTDDVLLGASASLMNHAVKSLVMGYLLSTFFPHPI